MLKSDKTLCGKLISELSPSSERKVELVCDICKKESITTYHNYRLAQEKFNRNGDTYCRSCSNKSSGVNKRGTPSPLKGKKFPERSGYNSPTWGGGKFISSDGYVMVYVGPREHKKEHILNVEHFLERKLENGEIVHHVNGNKLDNDISNLWVTNQRGHRKLHNQLQEIAYQLVVAGLVLFDNENEEYMAHIKLRELLGQLEEANQQPSLEGDF